MTDPRPTEIAAVNPADVRALADAEANGAPFLHWRTDGGLQQIHVLADDRWRVTIGRRPESDIALSWDPEVSRAHALLEYVGGQWTVVDDGLSSNGSFINGARVVTRQRLHDRDRLCFGQTYVVYREPLDPEKSDSTVRATGGAASLPLSETQRKILIALCRPVSESSFATPATNKQIAEELFLSIDAVKAHLRVLFERFGVDELPQNEKRARLAARVLIDGVLKPRDF